MKNKGPKGKTENSEFQYDQAGASLIEKKIEDKKLEIRGKVYPVEYNTSSLAGLLDFFDTKAQWNSTESLGVIEVCKQLTKIKEDGVKDNTVFLSALAIEASHYFLGKTTGSGKNSAEKFVALYKPMDRALSLVKADTAELQKLDKELIAVQQGIEMSEA